MFTNVFRKKRLISVVIAMIFHAIISNSYADKAAEVPHNTKVFNLCLIKKMGFGTWAKEKAGKVKRTYFKEKWKL